MLPWLPDVLDAAGASQHFATSEASSTIAAPAAARAACADLFCPVYSSGVAQDLLAPAVAKA